MDAVFPGGILSMTGEAADRLLKLGDGDAALLYLHLLRGPQAGALGWPEERRRAAFERLLRLGLAQAEQYTPAPAKPEPDGPPDYSTADLTRELEGDPTFRGLASEMERRLGKLLSTADLKTLYTMYDYLDLPAEVILLLTTWCIQEFERKYGRERRPRMSQLRQMAFRWHRAGVTTAEAAEAHLKKLSAVEGRQREILELLGIRDRLPVERERKYIAAWVEQGFADDALLLAYEKTVVKKGSLEWSYMNGILRRWHEKGLHTAAQVAASDSDHPRRPQAGDREPPGAIHPPQAGQVQSSVEQMRRLVAQMKQEKEG
jgi:DnaD/phage-associated family protein